LRVVEQAGHRRFRVGRHLDQVEVRLLGAFHRLSDLDDPELLAVGADQAHFRHADALVDPGRVALWWAPIEPARNRHYRSEESGIKRTRKRDTGTGRSVAARGVWRACRQVVAV